MKQCGAPQYPKSALRKEEEGYDEARRWFRLAAAQGKVYAIDHLRFIGGAP